MLTEFQWLAKILVERNTITATLNYTLSVSLVTFFSFVFILAKTVSRCCCCCCYYYHHSIIVLQTLFLPFQSHSRSGWVLKRENLLRLLEQNDFTWFSYYPAKLCSCVMATKYKRFRDSTNNELYIMISLEVIVHYSYS